MKQLNILIIGAPHTIEADEMVSSFTRHGHICHAITSDEIQIFMQKDKTYAMTLHGDIRTFDIIIRRVGSQKSIYASRVALESGAYIQDLQCLLQRNTKMDEMVRLSMHGIQIPRTFFIGRLESETDETRTFIEKEFTYPLILKGFPGSKGNNVFLANNFEEIEQVVKQTSDRINFFVQDFIGNREDYRIIVLYEKALGAMKKIAVDGAFKTNFSQGSKIEEAKLTPQLEEIAIKAAQVMQVDFAGVDVMVHEDVPYVLEVNNAPQFKGFTSVTNIPVAELFVQAVLDNYEAFH